MTPLQPIHNPMAAQMAAQKNWPMDYMLGAMASRANSYFPSKAYKRFIQPIPLGALVKLNPRLLK